MHGAGVSWWITLPVIVVVDVIFLSELSDSVENEVATTKPGEVRDLLS